MKFPIPAARFRLARRIMAAVAAAIAMLVSVVVATPPASAEPPVIVQVSDVLGQGGTGVYQGDGARLTRTASSVQVKWKVSTPEPGSYLYPSADQVPPGAPTHPEIVPGRPEVFTLWVFLFNHPELCNGPCDFDDIGPTPAGGGIFRADGTIAYGSKITLRADVNVGDAPAAGVGLTNPLGAEIHVAMTSHGNAYSGEALERQMNIAVGTPAHWWPALFFPA